MQYAYPKLSRCGLGNMMFTWAQAVAYCHRQNAAMIAPSRVKLFRIGPWIRREKYKRYYVNEFTNAGYVSGLCKWLILTCRSGKVKTFTGMEGFFDGLIDSQAIIRDELIRIVNPTIRSRVADLKNEGPVLV